MEAIGFFGILVMTYLMTWHHIQEESYLYIKLQQDQMKVLEVETTKLD
jgi:hypothetical protein